MMNVIDVQEQLKNFSEQQLISEMQTPTGSAPQFLVLSEIKRRKRVRDDLSRRQAAQEPSVAEEAVAAAGVPQSGIMGLSEAMAPKSTMVQNAVGSAMPQSMRSGGIGDLMPMAEGGVIRAANGLPLGLRQNNPGNIRPGAGFYGETGEGGGYATFGTEDEGLRAIARLLGTYDDKYGINTLRGLASRYAPRSDNKLSFDNYVSYLSNTLGMEPDEEFDLKGARGDLIPAIVGFEQGRDYEGRYSGDQIARAIRAAGTEDEAEIASILNDPDREVIPGVTAADLAQPDQKPGMFSAQASTGNQSPQEIFDEMQKNKGGAPFPSSLGELFAFGRDANVPVSERIGSRQDLQGQAAGEQQEYLQDTVADQITGESNEYQEYVRRSRLAGISPMSPSEYREKFSRGFKDAEGLADSSPASRAYPFSSVEPSEAASDAVAQAAKDAANKSMSGDPVAAAEIIEAAKKAGENIFDEGQRGAEKSGERAEYEASLRDSDDLGTAPTTVTTPVPAQPKTDGSGDTTGPTGISKEIADLQAKLEKDKETDKYLALAQAGLALMSSKEPTLLGAVGEAGISGLTAFREAQDRYQEGVVDLINARAKMQGKGSTFTTNQMIQRAQDLQTMAKDAELAGNPQRARELEIAANTLLSQAGFIGGSGSAISGFADQ